MSAHFTLTVDQSSGLVRWSPDGRLIATAVGNRLIIRSSDDIQLDIVKVSPLGRLMLVHSRGLRQRRDSGKGVQRPCSGSERRLILPDRWGVLCNLAPGDL